jgi:hypothetical protein
VFGDVGKFIAYVRMFDRRLTAAKEHRVGRCDAVDVVIDFTPQEEQYRPTVA